MVIHLKNKFLSALARILKECRDKGGIPDYIEMDPKEAFGLLKEINVCREYQSVKDKVRIDQNSDDVIDSRFMLWGKEPISGQDAATFIQNWLQRKYTITYDNVLLKVVKVREPQPMPKGPPNETVNEWSTNN